MKREHGILAVLATAALATLATSALTSAAAPTPETARTSPESYDLAQLRDGETRTFGEGDRTVVASRAGDVVTLAIHGPDERTVSCTVGKDNCYVTTMHGAEHTLLFLGDREHGPGMHTFAFSTGGSGEGDMGDEDVVIRSGGDGTLPGGSHVKVMHLRGGGGESGDDSSVFRCPQGDTTMTFKKDEAATSYLCPKHNVPLVEAQGGDRVMRQVVIERHGGDRDASAKDSGTK